MLSQLTKELFEPHCGTEFRIYLSDAQWVAAELVEVSGRGERTRRAPWAEPAAREPFSIIFRGPTAPVLPQHMYRLTHAAIGQIDDLFLVPVGINQQGCFYEAVFS